MQLGGGQLAAVLTILGIFAGNWLYVHLALGYRLLRRPGKIQDPRAGPARLLL